jgi:hypothetical protein
MPSAENVYLLSGFVSSGLLSIGFLAVLIRVRLGSRYGLVTLLVLLLLASNVASVALSVVFYNFEQTSNKTAT